MAVKISKNIAKRIGKSITTVYALFLSWFSAYKSRVETDSGTIQSEADSKTIFQMLEDNDLYDNTKLLITGEGGIKTRTDGVNVYVPKAYDFSENNNDSTQTTEADQPYLGSFIAPNEFQCFKNVNGETRYFEHPQISFASDEAWSISIVLNWSSSSSTRDAILGDTAGQTAFRIKDTTNVFRIVGDNNAITGSTSTSTLIGKLSIISFVYNGSNTITIYKNGVLFDSLLITDSFTFSSILRGGSYYFSGLIKYTRIQSGAMTTDQITAEYTALRAMIPEIESVTIGTQEWATSNFEAVATPMGNVIQEVTDNATWADSQNIYDTTYAATSGTAAEKEQAALEAAAMWCYYNNDTANGAVYGKLYNWFAAKLLQNDIDTYNASNPDWGWHVPTEAEFTTLETYLGGSSVAGGKMKLAGTDYWNSLNTGDNSSGFSAIPNGRRFNTSFSLKGTHATFITQDNVYVRLSDNIIETLTTSENNGFGLRLLKD